MDEDSEESLVFLRCYFRGKPYDLLEGG